MGNKIFNTCEPAEIIYYPTGVVKEQRYYFNGVINAPEHPLIKSTFYGSEYSLMSFKNSNGVFPAILKYYESGRIKCIQFWKNGGPDILQSPFRIKYHENGKIERKDSWIIRYGKMATMKTVILNIKKSKFIILYLT